MKDLEQLAEKVKDMRGLQVRYNKAKARGMKPQITYLWPMVEAAEKEVDEILLKHFYTPVNEQSNLFK